MKRYILILAALAFCVSPPLAGDLAGDLAGGSAAAASIDAGDDGFRVLAGPNSVFDLSVIPIPADFFGPGSDPFSDTILVEGATGEIDTVVSRLDSTGDLDPPPNTATIDIEIVALNLRSLDPITVTFNGGQNPETWDVKVVLSETAPPPGQMEITKEDANGGTFTADFPVQPRFTFTKVEDLGDIRVLDTGLEGSPALQYQLMDPYPAAPWSTVSPFPFPVPPGGYFFPGVTGGNPEPLVFDAGGGDNRLELVLHAIPEPSSLILLSMGAVALLGHAWRRRRWC
jgi:hypothetical protein